MTWKKKLDNAISKAYRTFWVCRSMFAKMWGLKPKVIITRYTLRL
jgi:hypothetical protein